MPTITPLEAVKGPITVDAPESSQPISAEKRAAAMRLLGVDTKASISSAVASAVVEAPTTPTEAPDPRIEALAAREKALQSQARAFKAERDAFMADKAKASELSQSKAFDKNAFLSDPTAYGLTPEELSQATLGQLNQSPETVRIRQLEAKLAQLEAGQKKTLDTVEATNTQAYANAVKQISHEVSLLVNNNDAYEAVRHMGATQDVVSYIEKEYKATGIVLDYKEAAQSIEDKLREQIQGYSKLSFLAAKKDAPADASPAVPAQPRTPTLTHAMSQASRTPGRMSDKDRIERAKLAFSGQLK